MTAAKKTAKAVKTKGAKPKAPFNARQLAELQEIAAEAVAATHPKATHPDPRTCIGVGPNDTRVRLAGSMEEAEAYAATLPRRPTDVDALRDVQNDLDELREDYVSLWYALRGTDPEDALLCTMNRLNARLEDAALKLEASRGGQVVQP